MSNTAGNISGIIVFALLATGGFFHNAPSREINEKKTNSKKEEFFTSGRGTTHEQRDVKKTRFTILDSRARKVDYALSGNNTYNLYSIVEPVDDNNFSQEDGRISLSDSPPHLLPKAFSLMQNYPNPFNPITTIQYQLPESVGECVHVVLEVFDIRGRKITTLVDSKKNPGIYSVQWDGRGDRGEPTSSGLFFYRIQAGDYHKVRRMVLLK